MMNRKILSVLMVLAFLANVLTMLPANSAYEVDTADNYISSTLPDGILTVSPPLWISGDGDFIPANGVSGGNGTAGNPYIIENLEIDGSGAEACIYIQNTIKYFTIRNCTLENADGSGVSIYGDTNANVTNCTIMNNGAGGIGMIGVPETSIIRAEIHDNIISENVGLAPIRLGSKLILAQDDLPVNSIYTNITNNDIINPSGNLDGIVMIYATEYIQANIVDNNFNTPQTQNGVHIGKMSNEYSKNPGVKAVDVNFINNELTNIAAGALIICSTETMYANVSDNHIYHTTGITCGAVTIGWFKAGVDSSTPKNATVILKNNVLDKVADTIGFGVKAIYDLNVTIENNIVSSVNAPGIRVGWLGDGDASNAPEPWAYPTRNVHGSISNNTLTGGRYQGIWLYSLNDSVVMDNHISGREGTLTNGDGIRIQGASGNNIVSGNTISGSESVGIRLYGSRDVIVKDNTLNSNFYGLGVDQYSKQNKFYSNTILKSDYQYGYYIGINSLDHSYPANNTVNGEWLRYFYGDVGAVGALIPIQNQVVHEPFMSNQGQVIVANASYVEVKDNVANNGSYGLSLINTQNSVVFDNHCEDNNVIGLAIREISGDNSVFQNTLKNNVYGAGVAGITSGNILWNNLITKEITQTGIYIGTTGYSWENTIFENNTVNGEIVRYYFGETGHSTTGEQIQVSYLTNIGQIVYVNSSDIQINDMDIQSGVNGIYIINSIKADVQNSVLLNNNNGVVASTIDDLELTNVTITSNNYNAYLVNVGISNIENCHLIDGDRSIYLYGTDALLSNTTIENPASASMFLNYDSDPNLINTTFDKDMIHIEDIFSSLNVSWYLRMHVSCNDHNVSGADIQIFDVNGTNVFDDITNEDGWIEQLMITEYTILEGNITENRSPYNITVMKEGFEDLNTTANMDQTTVLFIDMVDKKAPLIKNISLSPSNITGMSSDWVWLNATVDDEANGWSNITQAEWYHSTHYPTIDNGTGNPCNVSNSSLDSYLKNVTAILEIPDYPKGVNTFWIHASDEGGNWGEWESINLTIFDDWGPVVVSAPAIQPYPFASSQDEITITTTFDDETRGRSVIIGIDWRFIGEWPAGVNLTEASSISSLDLAFDEWKESIELWFNTTSWERGTYVLEIRGIDIHDNRGEWTNITIEVLDDEAPDAPSGLVASNMANGDIKLSWDSSTETDLVGYIVYRSESSGRRYSIVASILATSNTSFVDVTSVHGTTYYYIITAFDDQSPPNESPYSNEVSGTFTIPADDADTDGDGTLDIDDAFPDDPYEDTDTDGDGIGDNADPDDDDDGIMDEDDAFPLDPNEGSDADGDGIGDSHDAFPNDPDEHADADGDGIGDNADPDDDNDGTLDEDDAFPYDPNEDTDSDGDGIGDNADTDDTTTDDGTVDEGSDNDYIYIIILVVVLIVISVVLMLMKGRGSKGIEEKPEAPEKVEEITEETSVPEDDE